MTAEQGIVRSGHVGHIDVADSIPVRRDGQQEDLREALKGD